MPGPRPKPVSERRRRNVEPAKKALPVGRSRRAPVLPGAADLLPSTRVYWRVLWASPMAWMWLPADVPALVRLARLEDLVARELRGWAVREVGGLGRVDEHPELVHVTLAGKLVSQQLLAEMRQLEDRFGLSPRARESLRWDEPVSDAGAVTKVAAADELAARRARFEKAARG